MINLGWFHQITLTKQRRLIRETSGRKQQDYRKISRNGTSNSEPSLTVTSLKFTELCNIRTHFTAKWPKRSRYFRVAILRKTKHPACGRIRSTTSIVMSSLREGCTIHLPSQHSHLFCILTLAHKYEIRMTKDDFSSQNSIPGWIRTPKRW